MLQSIAILLLTILTACVAPEGRSIDVPYHVYLKSQDEDNVRRDVTLEAHRWNEALGQVVFILHMDEEPPADGCYVSVGFGGRLANPSDQAACDLADPCRISINLSHNGYWNTTIAHELGHVLGLPDDDTCADEKDWDLPECKAAHDGPEQSIMYQGTLNRTITEDDVANVLSLISR